MHNIVEKHIGIIFDVSNVLEFLDIGRYLIILW